MRILHRLDSARFRERAKTAPKSAYFQIKKGHIRYIYLSHPPTITGTAECHDKTASYYALMCNGLERSDKKTKLKGQMSAHIAKCFYKLEIVK